MFERCLLCGSETGCDEGEAAAADPEEHQKQLKRCMGRHMKSLALLSLPEDLEVEGDLCAPAGSKSGPRDDVRGSDDDSNVSRKVRE